MSHKCLVFDNSIGLCCIFLHRTHAVPPGCLLDQSLGSHEYVTANGIKFHYVTAGDRSKPLMLFLHGFFEVYTYGY